MSGDLTTNKILGAVLATGLVIMGIKVGSDAIYASEAPEKPGYLIEVAEEGGGEGATVELLPDWGTLMPTADVAAGEATFNTKCTSCHNIASGGPNMTGPNLFGVVGRPVASHAGFAYSEAMKGHVAEAPVWSFDAIDTFLKAPGKAVKGTAMSFAGIKKQEERVNLIAYLHSQGSTGYAVPAPDPTRQPGAAAPAAESAAAPDAASAAAPAASAATAPAATAPAVAAPAPAAH